MATYYDTRTKEKIKARQVKDNTEALATRDGTATITKGNWIVEAEDGNKFGVADSEFGVIYSKTAPKTTK